jgi:hypothetical protein
MVATEDAKKTRTFLVEGDAPTLQVRGSERVARDADAVAFTQQEEKKWRALFQGGLVNLESVPVLQGNLLWSRCDDVEVRVLLRARGGAKLAVILDDATYSADQITRAICRLAGRGLLQIP